MRHRLKWLAYLALGVLLGGVVAGVQFYGPLRHAWAQAPAAGLAPTDQGKILPFPEPAIKPFTEVDARNVKAPPRFEVKPPKDAPNIVIVLIDDIGFGHSSAFGGPIEMKTAERLAKNGLKYNRFHTTALCSPTRMALLTGRNHHSCNAGSITETSTAFPGNTGVRPASIATLAETLRLWGYITGAFGKYHETAPWEISPSGPFDRWPTRSGFDKFYGFLGGETNQWFPSIYDGTVRVEPPHDPNYHFTTDMTNKAIQWMRTTRSLTPDRPFYMYFATGATHAPHQAPKEFIDKYKGKFDGGWDKLREETFKRQIELGVVPPSTKLTPMHKDVKAWDTLSDDEKKLFARQMEVYAGFGEHTDTEIGRLVDSLEEMGELDNTLLFFIIGDNGASAEGGLEGTFNEIIFFNGQQQLNTVPGQLKRINDLGGPMSYAHFAVGWAIAGNTPFQWCKQMAAFFGGTRNPMIVHWPKGIKAKNEVRSQFHHVIDVCPTALEAAGIPQPDVVNGVKQRPIEGVSILYSFNDAKAKDRRTTQYFEMFGNRAIYHEGWTACTAHSIPWDSTFKPPSFDKDRWELYHVDEDFSQSNDLAAKNPEKLKELQALFLKEAVKYNVLPLDDRRIERFNPTLVGRPDLMGGRKKLTLYEGMTGMQENTFINVKNASLSITAEVEIPKDGGNGVLLAQGGRFGGYSLYLKEGAVKYVYNWLDAERYSIASQDKVPAGKATIRFEFAYDGGPPGSGGKGTLFVNDKQVAEGKIANTMGFAFGIDETADVGLDEATPVTEDYPTGHANRFNGKIRRITVDVK